MMMSQIQPGGSTIGSNHSGVAGAGGSISMQSISGGGASTQQTILGGAGGANHQSNSMMGEVGQNKPRVAS